MRLTQYLINEKLNLNYKLDSVSDSEWGFTTEWEIDGNEYEFSGIRTRPEDIAKNPNIPDEVRNIDSPWEVVFETFDFGKGSSPVSITGKMGSKAIEVFSAAATSLKKFISKKKPEVFYFTAKEPSRVKLYDKLSKLLTAMTPYKLITNKTDEKYYIFKRK